METAEEVQKRLIEEFAGFADDPLSLYEYLLGFAAELPVMSEEDKRNATLVKGCQSQVWLRVTYDDRGRLTIALDSDTLIVRGVLHAIMQIYSNRTGDEIRNEKFTFLDESGLSELFSTERRNGIRSIMKSLEKAADSAPPL